MKQITKTSENKTLFCVYTCKLLKNSLYLYCELKNKINDKPELTLQTAGS